MSVDRNGHVLDERGWHVQKNIDLTGIFSAMMIIATIVFVAGGIEQRIANVERQRLEDIARIERVRSEDVARAEREQQEFLRRLDKFDSKLDKLLSKERD